jgi:DNA-binding GntR family transcriptional regulator
MSASHAERLTLIIEEEILSLRLKPGDKLDETRLAERYGTSRTPVREALRQLAAHGLIELRPHRGAAVAKLGLRDLVELLEVVAELEGACGRLAAKACLTSDLEVIRQALDHCRTCASAADVQGYKLANEAFHEAICQASRNSCMIQLIRSCRKRIASYRRAQLEQASRIRNSVEDHERIALAIEEGRPEDADRLLQVHILNIGADLRQLITMAAANEQPAAGNGAGGGGFAGARSGLVPGKKNGRRGGA